MKDFFDTPRYSDFHLICMALGTGIGSHFGLLPGLAIALVVGVGVPVAVRLIRSR